MTRPGRSIVTSLLLLVLLVAAAAAPGAAQDDDTATDGTAAAESGAPDDDGDVAEPVELVSQTTWIRPDGDIALRLDVTGAARDDRLVVVIYEELPGRYLLDDSFRGERLPARLRTMTEGTVDELDPDGDGRVDSTLGLRSDPTGDPARLLLGEEGLHPVVVDINRPDGSRKGGFVTHIARLPADADQLAERRHQLAVALVQPLDGPLSLGSDGASAVAPEAESTLRGAVASLGLDPAVPLTYRLTPETLTGLAATGVAAHAELLGQLQQMLGAGTVAVSPYVDVHVDALVDAGLEDLLAEELDRGAAALGQHLGLAPDGATWVADDDLGPTGLAALHDLGVTRVVVPHDSLLGERPDLLVQPFGLIGGDDSRVTALATDPGLQSHAGSTGSSTLDAQHLLSDLAAIWFERPGYARGTAIVLPEREPDRAFLVAVVQGLADSPLLAPGSVSDVIAGADLAPKGDIGSTVDGPEDLLNVELADPEDPPDMATLGTHLPRTRRAVETFSSVFPESDRHLAYAERIAVAAAADLSANDRSRYLATVRAEIDDALHSIAMPERAAITLPSRDGVIPVTLVNNSGATAHVVIELQSDKLEFLDGRRIEQTLTAQFTPIEIRVRALASGAFPLDMSLETPDGRVQLVDSRYTVRSTAVSGLGILLSAAAMVVLGAWWVRTARRARADHRAALARQETTAADL